MVVQRAHQNALMHNTREASHVLNACLITKATTKIERTCWKGVSFSFKHNSFTRHRSKFFKPQIFQSNLQTPTLQKILRSGYVCRVSQSSPTNYFDEDEEEECEESHPSSRSETSEGELLPPSEEQAAIVKAFQDGNNVLVNAVAGSGKTTTILHCGAAAPWKKILVMTYNTRLKLATRAAIAEYGLTNIEAHSFHSAGGTFYGKRGNMSEFATDKGLKTLIRKYTPPRRRLNFDCLIVDEAQDLTPLLYQFVEKVRRDNVCPGDSTRELQLLVLGDERQSIYNFKASDVRYMTRSHITLLSSIPWVSLPLHTSFRNTRNICRFVNEAMLGFPLMRVPDSKRNGPPVKYITGCPWESAKYIFEELLRGFNSGRFLPEDVFVLAPSVKTKGTAKPSPLRTLENRLVNDGIKVYVSSNDNEALDDKVIAKKVAFTTFHSSKGLERKVVVIFSFNDAYFKYYARDTRDLTLCPNPMYVAVTRAKEYLYLVAEEVEEGHLPFLCHAVIDQQSVSPRPFVEKVVRDRLRSKRLETEPPEDVSIFSVSDLCRFAPEYVLEATEDLVECVLEEPHLDIDIPHTIVNEEENLVEVVSHITGTALPAMYEFNCFQRCSIQKGLKEYVEEQRSRYSRWQAEGLESLLQDEPRSIADFLRLAAWFESRDSGYLNAPVQKPHFDWLSQPSAHSCLQVLKDNLPSEQIHAFELKLSVKSRFPDGHPNGPLVELRGQVDAVTTSALWEIKCVSALTAEHVLQLACYAWLWERKRNGKQQPCSDTGDWTQGRVTAEQKGRLGIWDPQKTTSDEEKVYGVKGEDQIGGFKEARLLNIRTGEVKQLTSNMEKINAVMNMAVEAKRRYQEQIPDEEFFKHCESLRRKATPSREELHPCNPIFVPSNPTVLSDNMLTFMTECCDEESLDGGFGDKNVDEPPF